MDNGNPQNNKPKCQNCEKQIKFVEEKLVYAYKLDQLEISENKNKLDFANTNCQH